MSFRGAVAVSESYRVDEFNRPVKALVAVAGAGGMAVIQTVS